VDEERRGTVSSSMNFGTAAHARRSSPAAGAMAAQYGKPRGDGALDLSLVHGRQCASTPPRGSRQSAEGNSDPAAQVAPRVSSRVPSRGRFTGDSPSRADLGHMVSSLREVRTMRASAGQCWLGRHSLRVAVFGRVRDGLVVHVGFLR